MTNWIPRLGSEDAPQYVRIADAIERDIGDGSIRPGQRLPAYRTLAFALKSAPGTINRAYDVLAKRGLVTCEVGRGTFVCGRRDGREPSGKLAIGAQHDRNFVDLTLNLSMVGDSEHLLSETLGDLRRDRNLSSLLEYKPAGGMARHRQSGVKWLARWGVAATTSQVIVCNGAQHGLLICLLSVARAGDTVITDSITYPGMIAIANQLGISLRGVTTDEFGMRPDSLERACHDNRAKAVYCMPIIHNPLTATMSCERMTAIAAVARAHGVWIIEDDVYGFLVGDETTRLAAIAPERTYYINSASKCMAPGLRIGFICVPEPEIQTVEAVARMTDWMTAPLMAEIASRWIMDGQADQLVRWHREQASRRQAIVRQMLDGLQIDTHPQSYHVWLRLPSDWRSDAFVAELFEQGVIVLPAEAFATRRESCPHAVRICLGSVRDEGALASALARIAKLIKRPSRPVMPLL